MIYIYILWIIYNAILFSKDNIDIDNDNNIDKDLLDNDDSDENDNCIEKDDNDKNNDDSISNEVMCNYSISEVFEYTTKFYEKNIKMIKNY